MNKLSVGQSLGVSCVCQLGGKGGKEQEQTGTLGCYAILAYDCAIQWHLSMEDTIWTQLAILYKEVSLIHRKICTQVLRLQTVSSLERCPL